jgi:putative ATPase
MPEARIPLAAAAIYLATAPKSNRAYRALQGAAQAVAEHGPLPVPPHLRNAPTGLARALGHGVGYQYAHDQPDGLPDHAHLPDAIRGRRFYEPGEYGAERVVAERLHAARRRRGG